MDKNPFEVVDSYNKDKEPSQKVEQEKGMSNMEQEFDFLKKIPAKYVNKKFFFAAIFAVFLVGIFFGALMFGGDDSKPAQSGLAGVIPNPEVPAGRSRCGMVEYGQGCVLYIVNSQRREIMAKELYELAASMTKVPVYIIETSNLRYSNTLIKPGYIAQINIQPIR